MITTDTGAKKIENTDNWRLIFDAHNDSVDAEDKIVPEMAPIVNGNKSTVGAAIGEYVLVRNSSITGITDGAYTAAKAIPANTTIDSTYLTAVGTGGALNALNSKIGHPDYANGTDIKPDLNTTAKTYSVTANGWVLIDLTGNNNNAVMFCALTVNSTTAMRIAIQGTSTTSGRAYYTTVIPVSAGDTLQFTALTNVDLSNSAVKFLPMK